MQFSRREIIDQYLLFKNALNDDDQRTLAEQILNWAILDIWLAHPFADHRLPNPVQITTVAGTRTYVLPSYFGRLPPRVEFLRNLTTGAKIWLRSQDRLDTERPINGTTLESAGTPDLAVIGGVVGVSVQPAAAGQALEVLSSSADDTDVRVTVEGVNSGGNWDETQVTLTGLVAVAIGTWKEPLVNFAKAYPAGTTPPTALTSSRGTVTLRVAGAGATLQALLPEESAREFPSLILSPKPLTAGELIGIPTLRAPKRLLYDADEVPRYWGSAILERMKDYWNVSSGENRDLPMRFGPALTKLVQHDNATQTGRIRTRGFSG